MQYLKESYRYPHFFTEHRFLKLCHWQMVFTQIWYLHKQGLQDQNKSITSCAEFTLQWRNYLIWRYIFTANESSCAQRLICQPRQFLCPFSTLHNSAKICFWTCSENLKPCRYPSPRWAHWNPDRWCSRRSRLGPCVPVRSWELKTVFFFMNKIVYSMNSKYSNV